VSSKFLYCPLKHLLFNGLRLSVFSLLVLLPIAIGTKPRRFREMVFSVKTKVLSRLAFLETQLLVNKFLGSSTIVADHEAVATFFIAQGTLHESTARQNSVN
jgi:hypothetical protein